MADGGGLLSKKYEVVLCNRENLMSCRDVVLRRTFNNVRGYKWASYGTSYFPLANRLEPSMGAI